MFNIISLYLNKLTIDDVTKFASSKNVTLSNEELSFTYNFIKKNGLSILKNPALFDINRYSKYYTPENFLKIKQVYNEYYQKFNERQSLL